MKIELTDVLHGALSGKTIECKYLVLEHYSQIGDWVYGREIECVLPLNLAPLPENPFESLSRAHATIAKQEEEIKKLRAELERSRATAAVPAPKPDLTAIRQKFWADAFSRQSDLVLHAIKNHSQSIQTKPSDSADMALEQFDKRFPA